MLATGGPELADEENLRLEIEKGSDLGREPTEDLRSFSFKPRRFFSNRIVISILIFLFLIASLALIIYTFFSNSLSDKTFFGKLVEYIESHHPTISPKLKEAYKKELNQMYKQGMITDNYDLELETLIQFHKFMHRYKRNYQGDERIKRHLLFRRRYFDVRDQKGDRGYLKGINRFSDLTKEERRKMFSKVKPLKNSHDPNKKEELNEMLTRHLNDPIYLNKLKQAKNLDHNISDATTITAEDLDWRRAQVLTPVKDQGDDCGSCWAFASVASVESIYKMLQDTELDLSTQHLMNCEKRCLSCDGGFADLALDFIKNEGIPESKAVPYHAHDEKCVDTDSDRYFIDMFSVMSGDEIFKKSLVISPTVVNIGASDRLFDYKSGIYDDECSVQLNHSVLLVGEGYDPETKKRYWIIKNSWGTHWGENGYFRLERTNEGLDKCGILTVGLNPYINHYLPSAYTAHGWF